ncbi:MAG: MBL fold metallo-hydrolase [Acutalibacter sp.]|nr:MBL fold metallo-hydrolase [Acutalibacter sp.]
MFPEIQGKIDSYDIIVIGHQRANVYFGDDPKKPPRGKPVTCTSTLVQGRCEDGSPYALLIDPTTRSTPEDFYFELRRRSGLLPEDITHCFSTHEHFDHIEGLTYFPQAAWMVEARNRPWVGASMLVDKAKLVPVQGEFLPGVYAVPLPGHTYTACGIAFAYEGRKYLAAGDAVVSRHHFKELANNFEDDPAAARATQQMILKTYDVVIPGHDNLFLIQVPRG